MDSDNPIIKLCVAGTQAEFQGKMDEACELYRQAWETANDDYEACVAAHYVARCQVSPEDILRWNREALERANAVKYDSIREFYPSLFLNMGRSYELVGQHTEAEEYYQRAADLGVTHEMGAEHERHI